MGDVDSWLGRVHGPQLPVLQPAELAAQATAAHLIELAAHPSASVSATEAEVFAAVNHFLPGAPDDDRYVRACWLVAGARTVSAVSAMIEHAAAQAAGLRPGTEPPQEDPARDGGRPEPTATPTENPDRDRPYVTCFPSVKLANGTDAQLPIDAVLHVLAPRIIGDEPDHRVLPQTVTLILTPEALRDIGPWVPMFPGPNGERAAAVPGFCPLALAAHPAPSESEEQQ